MLVSSVDGSEGSRVSPWVLGALRWVQEGAGQNGRAQGRPSLSFSWQWDFGEGKRASTEMVVVLAAVMVVPAVAPEHRSGRSRAGSAAASALQSVQGTVPVLAGSWK